MIGRGFKWPNKVSPVPEQVFGGRAVLVPDGFLVPGHKTGGIHVILLEGHRQVKLTEDREGYFYHMGVWRDFNGDGRLDLLTARSNAKKGGGQLLWLENNGRLEAWPEHLITEGPDIVFTVAELDQDPNTIEVISG